MPVSIISYHSTRFSSHFWNLFQGGLGTKVNLNTTFHPQSDGQAEKTTQTLEDMLQACVIDYSGSWVDHLPLIDFAYNNNYHSRIRMASFKALYHRRYRSPIRWFEVGEAEMFGPDLVHQAMEKVKVIWDTLSRSGQKSYADIRHRELDFAVSD